MKVRSFRISSETRRKLVADLLQRPGDLLVTLMILNVMVNLLIQNVVSSLFGDKAGWGQSVGIPLCLTLVFGEVIPKSLAIASNEAISQKVASFFSQVRKAITPVRVLLVAVTSHVARFLFFFLKRESEISPTISLAELKHALDASRQYDLLSEEEARLMKGYLSLEEATAKELMRPRQEILYHDLQDPLSELIELMVDKKCSRVPICRGSLDEVVGVLESRDFFLHRDRILQSEELSRYTTKPFFVPETLSGRTLLRQIYDRKEALALVVDEYGLITGVISLQDLVDMVMGEMGERPPDEKTLYTRSGSDVIIASGKMELIDLEQVFQVDLPSPSHMATIGGWIIEHLGDIPTNGVQFSYGSLFFHILAADPSRVRRVYVRKLPHEAPLKKRSSFWRGR